MSESLHSEKPIIELPAVLLGEPTWGSWTIRYCQEKLMCKYGGGRERNYQSLEFDSYAAARTACDQGWCNRIDGADLVVTQLMNSNIVPADINRLMVDESRISKALSSIPQGLSLGEPIADAVWAAVLDTFEAMERDNIGLAKITKVLCMKRPLLVPMIYIYVLEALFQKLRNRWPVRLAGKTYAQGGVIAMRRLQGLMHHGQNMSALDRITKDMNEWLVTRVVNRAPPTLTPIRVLESLLWFDWWGYSTFAGWIHRDGEVQPS